MFYLSQAGAHVGPSVYLVGLSFNVDEQKLATLRQCVDTCDCIADIKIEEL